jgi:hypothetical protein
VTAAFGDFRLRIDPWEVNYGDQTPLSPTDDEPDETVDHEIEIAEASWQAIIPPGHTPIHHRVVFIDGVRRLEARVLARQDERLIYGGFGSFAVGAVVIENSSACFGALRTFRVAVLGAGERLPRPIQIRQSLVYEPESTPNSEVDGPLRHIQKSMRLQEATLARDLCSDDSLTIVDGPLSFEPERRGVALGYIKRVHELYVPARFIPLLATLPAGARTPMFSIQAAKSGFPRYSWFQRLADPDRGASELHGIVRLEVAADVGVDAARNLANAATTWLPRTAPKRARDPRSPQNLLPIGALEQKLRVALGDVRLFRRWIEELVATEASLG